MEHHLNERGWIFLVIIGSRACRAGLLQVFLCAQDRRANRPLRRKELSCFKIVQKLTLTYLLQARALDFDICGLWLLPRARMGPIYKLCQKKIIKDDLLLNIFRCSKFLQYFGELWSQLWPSRCGILDSLGKRLNKISWIGVVAHWNLDLYNLEKGGLLSSRSFEARLLCPPAPAVTRSATARNRLR